MKEEKKEPEVVEAIKIPEEIEDLTEENLDGLNHLVRGICMMYNSSIDNRMKIQDMMDEVRRKNPEGMKLTTLSVINVFNKEFSTILSCIYTSMTIFKENIKEDK